MASVECNSAIGEVLVGRKLSHQLLSAIENKYAVTIFWQFVNSKRAVDIVKIAHMLCVFWNLRSGLTINNGEDEERTVAQTVCLKDLMRR